MLGAYVFGNSAAMASGAKTYAQFQAQIDTLATNGSVGFNSGIVAGKFRTTAIAVSGTMQGSSWVPPIRASVSAVSRAIQHGMPSQAAFDAVVAAGYESYFETFDDGSSGPDFFSENRNGYTSIGTTATATSLRMSDLIYWDGTQAQRMNPNANTGPTPYTW